MSYAAAMDPAEVIKFLHAYGHLEFPFGHQQDIPSDLSKLTLQDEVVREALRSHQSFDYGYVRAVKVHHGRQRQLVPDGDIGPATIEMLQTARCGCPDYAAAHDADEAVGSGSWKGCHGIGNFHAAKIHVTNSPPDFLAPHWDTVKRRVVQAYEEIGLRWMFDAPQGGHQTELTFADRSDGWIGLAIVGQGETCTSQPIWLKLLKTYRGGNSAEQIIIQWTTLTKHELGHNCGLGHSRGGVMNPSIVDGLPISWVGDQSESLLRRKFGGERVPGNSPDPGPGPGPGPFPGDIEIDGRLSINGRPYLLVPDPYGGM